MKKPNIIIGKKHVILACLTLILGVAIYLNFIFAQPKLEKGDAAVSGKSDTVNYGDTAFVSNENGDDYFAKARLDRTTKREAAVQSLQTMMNGGDVTAEEKATLTQEALTTSKLVETEGVVENLIKAQGFKDCVVYLDGKSANIVVKSEGLVPSEAAQIKEILLSKISVPQENITIFEVK